MPEDRETEKEARWEQGQEKEEKQDEWKEQRIND